MSDSFGDLAESCAHRKPRLQGFGQTHPPLGRKPTPNSCRVHNSARGKHELPAAVLRGFIKCTPDSCRKLVFAPCGNVIPAAVRRRFRRDFKPGSCRNQKSTKNVKMAIRRLQQGREGDCRSQARMRFSKPSQRAGATTISAEWGAADVATREALYS